MKKFASVVSALAILFAPVAFAQGVQFKATLSWADNSANEDGFRIERSDTNPATTFATVGSVGAGVVSFVDQPLAPGSAVCYRIVAFNVAGDSAPSAVACGDVPSQPAPAGTLQLVITVAP